MAGLLNIGLPASEPSAAAGAQPSAGSPSKKVVWAASPAIAQPSAFFSVCDVILVFVCFSARTFLFLFVVALSPPGFAVST